MEWSMSQPLLFCLPALICLGIHVLITAGLLLRSKPGIYRFFVFFTGSGFLLFYLLFLNYGYTLATTRLSVDYHKQQLDLCNQYGSIQIPAESIESVLVEGSIEQPHTIWVVSKKQVLYLDRHYFGWDQFLPALAKLIDLGQPIKQGETTLYRVHPGLDEFLPGRLGLDLMEERNTLKGNTLYYLPWLFVIPAAFYILGLKAWSGQIQHFKYLAMIYVPPVLILAVIAKPSLPLVMFLILYPLFLLFFCAMCLPKANGTAE